jgi:hypothetical protein
MTFRSQLSTDADVFLNTDEYAETVDYTPKGASKITGIQAVVFRELEDTRSSDRHKRFQRRAIIYIKRSDVATVTKGFDTVEFPTLEGGAQNATWRVISVHDRDDPALWKLEVVD